MESNYNEKELAVFDGLISLLRQGAELHGIKVSDIAQAAGIGKGTIYNYFTSKEEIVAKAAFYCVCQMLQELEETVQGKTGFYDKCCAILDFAQRYSPSGKSNLWLFSQMTIEEFKNVREFKKEKVPLCYTKLREIVWNLILLGEKEGVIAAEQDAGFALQVFLGTVCGYVQMCELQGEVGRNLHLRDNAYKMLVKSLNQ